MGVTGLLGLLRSIQKPTTLKNFSGQTIGIDAFGWLYRGTVTCPLELALGRPTTKYVDFAVNRVRMLLDFGITPYLVFDGDAVPSKAGTNEERRKRREEAKTLGLSLWRSGNKSEAYRELQKAASITPQMTLQLIEALKKMNVAYVVAPYEADAQLVYLENKGIIDCILSEDSDLLVFGAKRLITKLDQYGDCIEIERKDFPLCKEVSFAGWTDAMFRAMAILSGCDYVNNVSRMGLKTAHEYVRKYKDPNKVIHMMSLNGKYRVPSEYSNGYKNAELTFLHHRVFCPIKQEMVFLNDLERGMNEEDMPFLGPYVEPAIAIDVARGHLNPKTKQPLELLLPSNGSRRALLDGMRQTTTSGPELKPTKSIDSFFKSYRQPLAELDPNSLTPSPSQQQVMQRNRNAQWQPHLVRSAPQLRPSPTRVYLDSHPESSSGERDSFLTRAGAVSQYKPTKRQRLCSDVNDVSPSQEIKHSPFFKADLHNASPLVQKTSRQRKAKRTDFDVWSDDSVEQIMLGFDEVCKESAEKPSDDSHFQKQLASYGSGKGKAASTESRPQSPVEEQEAKTKESQSSHGTEALYHLLLDSDEAAANSRSTHVNVKDDPEEFEDLLEFHVKKQNESVRENIRSRTFAHKSPQEQVAALERLKSPELPKDHQKQKSPEQELRSKESKVSPATMMKQNEKLSIIQTFVHQSPERQAFALKSLEVSQIPAGGTSPRNVRGKSTTKSRTPTMHESKGSEDNMVPNSEDEVSEAEDGGLQPRFDLKGFAYVK